MDRTTAILTRSVYSCDMIKCVKCGDPYVSAKMAKKISSILDKDEITKLCPNCRQRETYASLLGE